MSKWVNKLSNELAKRDDIHLNWKGIILIALASILLVSSSYPIFDRALRFWGYGRTEIEKFTAVVIAPILETGTLIYLARRLGMRAGFLVALVFTIAEAAYHTHAFSIDMMLARGLWYVILIRHMGFFFIASLWNFSFLAASAAITVHLVANLGITLTRLHDLDMYSIGVVLTETAYLILALASIIAIIKHYKVLGFSDGFKTK